MERKQSLNFSNDISETLLKTSRFAIFSAQIAGYLPLSVNSPSFKQGSRSDKSKNRNNNNNRRLLYHSWISIPTLASFIGLSVIIGWTTLYYVMFKPKIRFTRIFGPTETFAYTLLVSVGTFMGVFLRVRAFYKGIPEFFQEHCELFQNFEKLGLKVSKLKEISKIPKYMRISLLAYLIPLILHCILIHGMRPIQGYYKYKVWLPDIVYSMGSGVWVFWCYLLISNLWIVLFPRIYSACYKEISKDIKTTFKPKNISEMYVNQQSFLIMDFFGQNNNGNFDYIRLKEKESIELKVTGYLELIKNLEKMIDRYNQVFGERLLLEMITCITFIILYAFFGCFWANQNVGIWTSIEVITPLYVNGKKLVELGYSCGNISREAQISMKTLIDHVPLDKLSLGICRKIRLMQIQIQSSPPTVSAKQFFILSRGSVTTVLSGMAGFMVALVQFRQGE